MLNSESINSVHSYIGITPDFGSEKRGSTPRWTTKAAPAAFLALSHQPSAVSRQKNLNAEN
ncbi:MAG: hypothetical protein IJ718_06380 [Paludibacteraceae bacterium]|nr:hypothetical protein [Paludibacteraceae bacterium]